MPILRLHPQPALLDVRSREPDLRLHGRSWIAPSLRCRLEYSAASASQHLASHDAVGAAAALKLEWGGSWIRPAPAAVARE